MAHCFQKSAPSRKLPSPPRHSLAFSLKHLCSGVRCPRCPSVTLGAAETVSRRTQILREASLLTLEMLSPFPIYAGFELLLGLPVGFKATPSPELALREAAGTCQVSSGEASMQGCERLVLGED